jgi:hypothetical protein
MVQYIKGFEINRDKVATIVPCAKVDVAINIIIEQYLDRAGFKYIACGLREGHRVNWPLVIVLDDGFDEQALRESPLGEIHWSVQWVMDVLDGPDVWERSA